MSDCGKCDNHSASLRFWRQLSKAVCFLEICFSLRDESLQFRLKCGARSFLNTMKQLRSRVLWLFLISRVFISAAVETIDEESSNDNLLSNDFEYLYKLNGQPVNYLNYRAVYGLRYIPTKKPIKAHPNNVVEEFVAEKSTFNVTIPTQVDEVISTIENDDEEFASSDVESEIAVASTESVEKLTPHNFTNEIVEPVVDESRNHVMRPNNKVEHALGFLAGRLKTLLYHSVDPSRPESKISPPLSSLGKFLQLFNLIKFDNIPCVTAYKPLRQLGGTCYTEVECLHLGGIAVDRCANGFGVCCVCEFIDFSSPRSRARDNNLVCSQRRMWVSDTAECLVFREPRLPEGIAEKLGNLHFHSSSVEGRETSAYRVFVLRAAATDRR